MNRILVWACFPDGREASPSAVIEDSLELAMPTIARALAIPGCSVIVEPYVDSDEGRPDDPELSDWPTRHIVHVESSQG